MNLSKLLARYRTQVLLALGGVAAFATYQSRSQQAAAARAVAPVVIAPSGGDTGQFWQGIQAGAAIQAAGVAQGLAPTEASLGLAGQSVGVAGTVAQSAGVLAQAVTGDVAGLGGLLGSALAGIVGGWGSPSPPPAPSAPPLAASPPAAAQPPYPAPAADVPVGYRVAAQAGASGNRIRGFAVNDASSAKSERNIALLDGQAYSATRHVTAHGVLHWKMTSGPYNGISIVPGESTPVSAWTIEKLYRRADGSLYVVSISDNGS